MIAATAPLAAGYPFLTSFHATLDVPVLGAKMEFALAQLFDFGIFLLVAGGVMTAVLALSQDEAEERPPATRESPPSQSSSIRGEEGSVEGETESIAASESEQTESVETGVSVEGEK